MNDTFAKWVLGFLAFMYLLGCVGEIVIVKNGAEAVFESVKTIVPHLGMFVLGFYFSRK